MVKLTVGAGSAYPMEWQTLKRIVNDFCDAAQTPPALERLLGCIAPHSPYGLSGDVAGHAFKYLEKNQYDRVIVLAPAHHSALIECSVAAVTHYVTPLGFVPVDRAALARIAKSPLIATHAVIYKKASPRSKRKKLHELESAIEMVLPFLQERLGQFQLVPVLVGNLGGTVSVLNPKRARAVANVLKRIVDDRTLIVVSTDFTRYGEVFGYAPTLEAGRELIAIERLDREAFRLVLAKDALGLHEYLGRTKNPICGGTALQVFLEMLPKKAKGRVLAYQTSLAKIPDAEQSVSYAAINFYDPSLPRLAPPRPNSEVQGTASNGRNK